MLTAGNDLGGEATLAALALTARLLVALIFVLAGLAKLRDRAAFRQAVDRYQLLPDALVGPLAAIVPWVELAIGVALAAGVAAPPAAGTAATLLVAFAVVVAVNLARGQDIDCGCAGGVGAARISWWLVARNAALAVLAAGVAIVTAGGVRAPPAGDAVAAAVTVAAVLGTVRLLAHAAPVRAALRTGSATEMVDHPPGPADRSRARHGVTG